MRYSYFLRMCKERNWQELATFLESDFIELSSQILASAVFERYYPNTNLAKHYGLARWNSKLADFPIHPLFNLLAGKVDLIDFCKAHSMALEGTQDIALGLRDKDLADTIKQYVYDHRESLIDLLNCDEVLPSTKQAIYEAFGDLRLSLEEQQVLAEIEAFNREIDIKIMKKNLKKQILQNDLVQLCELMGYAPDEVKLSKDHSFGIIFNIYPKLSLKALNAYVEGLKAMGFDASYYNFSSDFYKGEKVRGIQIAEDFVGFSEKLALFKPLVEGKFGLFSHASDHFKKAQALREKTISDEQMAESAFGKASHTAKRLSH